jgi:hypothetical protein
MQQLFGQGAFNEETAIGLDRMTKSSISINLTAMLTGNSLPCSSPLRMGAVQKRSPRWRIPQDIPERLTVSVDSAMVLAATMGRCQQLGVKLYLS